MCYNFHALSFIQIFLIRSFLEYLSKGDVDIWVGLAYVGGVMVCELMKSVSLSVSWIISYQAGQQVLFSLMLTPTFFGINLINIHRGEMAY